MANEDGETSMIGAETVDTASIESATVTINTLTISGKQVAGVLPDFPIVEAEAALPRFGDAQIVLQ